MQRDVDSAIGQTLVPYVVPYVSMSQTVSTQLVRSGKHLAWLSISQADTSRHCSECKLTNVASRSHTLAAVYDSDLLSEHWTCGFRQAFGESMEK